MSKLPWIPNSNDEIVKRMLKSIGVSSIEDLFDDVPDKLKIKRRLKVGYGRPLSEVEVDRVVKALARDIKSIEDYISFLGGGTWPHYVPAVVKEIVSRAEFRTAYTPYQAEISQGLLQALFEYQSLMADLLEMDVVNSSMYDWSTALAEAVLMSVRINHRKRVLVPASMNPEHFQVLKTITSPKGIVIEKVKYDLKTGLISIEDLKNKMKNDVTAVYIENPSFLGFIEHQVDDIANIVHSHDSMFIVGVDPVSLGVLRPPGNYEADIVVGEAQPLGLGLNYGGPLLGIFAVRDDIRMIRQMPGRLIGMTTTLDGSETGFIMILQTREQHIRREKATSNICTNEALCAIASAVYLSLLGSSGLKELGELIMSLSHYATERIDEIKGVKAPLFESAFFKEFVVYFDTGTVTEINKELLSKRIIGGLPLSKYFPELGESALYCITEIHSKEDIDYLVEVLSKVMG